MRKEITHVRKDNDGDITDVLTPLGSEAIGTAIQFIEYGISSYYVAVDGARANVYVASRRGRKYLTTSPDGTRRNNLADLPEF